MFKVNNKDIIRILAIDSDFYFEHMWEISLPFFNHWWQKKFLNP